METSSNRGKVNHYGQKHTSALVDDAQNGVEDFELFMELHRRAAERHLKHNTRYEWDDKFGESRCSNANAVFVRDYGLKWGILQRGGSTYMMLLGVVFR